MGVTVTGLSLICVTGLYLVFEDVQPLTGFAFGASSIALFRARRRRHLHEGRRCRR